MCWELIGSLEAGSCDETEQTWGVCFLWTLSFDGLCVSAAAGHRPAQRLPRCGGHLPGVLRLGFTHHADAHRKQKQQPAGFRCIKSVSVTGCVFVGSAWNVSPAHVPDERPDPGSEGEGVTGSTETSQFGPIYHVKIRACFKLIIH